MKSALLLTSALALLVPAFPAHAQGVTATPNTRAGRRAHETGKSAAAEPAQAPLYPLATRKAPDLRGSAAAQKDIDALIKLQGEEGQEDAIIAKADEILANPKATDFDKSRAAYVAGAAWQGKDTEHYTNAIKYYQMAVDNNGLDNNTHYRAMLQLAQMQAADAHYAEALALVDRFLAETKADTDETATRVKGQILGAMDKPEEAAAVLEKALAAKPNDKKIMLSLAMRYVEAGQEAKAGALFDKMRAAGLLTESKDYDVGFRLLAGIDGREKDAISLIEEGLKKGVLQPSYDMYAVQGRAYYEAGDKAKAVEAWSKGAPLSKDGEMFLNLAKLQLDGGNWAAAKEAVMQAKAKGLKHPGDAWRVLARAETGLGNAAASKAAALEAGKYPDSRK
jgi:tetratricopeptide (TPR) repeat protein